MCLKIGSLTNGLSLNWQRWLRLAVLIPDLNDYDDLFMIEKGTI